MSITVSTITPVYYGEAYLEHLVKELANLKNKWHEQSAPLTLVEAIFVDDDAIDNSSQILAELTKQYSWIKVVSLSRNYGQHAATVAGICHSSSDWVVTLDEDLQHKPAEIVTLFKCQIANQSDVVYAKPKHAAHGNSWRDQSSRLVKAILAKLTSTPQIRLFNSFRLIRGSIARAAASSSSSHTYLDIAISWFTKSCATVEIDLHDDRFIGDNKSGYKLAKLIRHARCLIVNAQIDITSIGLIFGGLAVIVAFLVGISVVLLRLFSPMSIELAGWASITALVTFFGGIIIAILCILLEYINIVVLNQLGKPTFFTIDRSHDYLLRDWFTQAKL